MSLIIVPQEHLSQAPMNLSLEKKLPNLYLKVKLLQNISIS